MGKLKNTTKLVKKILEEVPETRNRDNTLYYHVCKETESVVLGMPFGMVLMNMENFKIPSFKSVERCRRKVQELHPELAPPEKVEVLRELEEEKYMNYARQVNV